MDEVMNMILNVIKKQIGRNFNVFEGDDKVEIYGCWDDTDGRKCNIPEFDIIKSSWNGKLSYTIVVYSRGIKLPFELLEKIKDKFGSGFNIEITVDNIDCDEEEYYGCDYELEIRIESI